MPTALRKEIPARRGNWEVQYFPEAASQTFVTGDLLAISSGTCTIAKAAGNDFNQDDGDFLGIAGEAASGTTGNKVQVHVPCDRGATFELPVEHATAASAVTAESQVGTEYELTHTSAGVWGVTIDTTSKPVVKVKDVSDRFAVGEQYGTVWVMPLAAYSFAE
jgi:hypothetical protein